MKYLLGLIKNKMNDDSAFDTEYKTKSDEIEKVLTDIKPHDGDLETN